MQHPTDMSASLPRAAWPLNAEGASHAPRLLNDVATLAGWKAVDSPTSLGTAKVLMKVSTVHAAMWTAGADRMPVRSIKADATSGAKPDRMVMQTL